MRLHRTSTDLLATAALASLALACSGEITGPAAAEDDLPGLDEAVDAGVDQPQADAAPEVPEVPAQVPRFFEWRGPLLGALELEDAVLDGSVVTLAPGGGAPGVDGSGFYNGGDYVVGAARSGEVDVATPFREAIVSWNATTPDGSWVEILLSARIGDRWTRDYNLGVWAARNGTISRHSVSGQADGDGTVYTDTLSLAAAADGYRVTVRLFAEPGAPAPELHGIAVATSRDGAAPVDLAPLEEAWGRAIEVPQRSQMIYPDGGEVWCSPTSTSMLLAFWAQELGRPDLVETVPEAAAATYDSVYGGNGNWPFNTAHAAALSGGSLRAVVTRLDRIEQLERLTAAGFPVVVSGSWSSGALSGAPISSTNGHIWIVRGFDESGNVMVNDPAGPNDGQVRFTYDRGQFDAAWSNSGRTVYLIHPVDRPLPSDGAAGLW